MESPPSQPGPRRLTVPVAGRAPVPAARSRVLVVSQPTTAGVAVHIHGMLRAAVNAGYLVTVACPPTGDLGQWALDAGADVVSMPLERSPRIRDLAFVLQLRQMFQNVDLVHLHSSKAGALGRIALATLPARKRPRCIFTPHAWSWLVGGRMSGVYRAIEYVLGPMADVTIAVSHGEERVGTAALGKRMSSIVVVENGVDTQHYRPGGQRIERPQGPYLVCVGRLSRQKGQSVAIRSLDLLDDETTRLGLVGGGEDSAALHDLASDLGLDERVDWYGVVDDSAPYLRSADVVVVPSRWEGLSLALLEAMACGAPVVASSVVGNDVIEGVGVLVPPDDPAAMADAVAHLLASPSLRRRYGGQARTRVCERYDLQRSVEQTLRVWRELLERSK